MHSSTQAVIAQATYDQHENRVFAAMETGNIIGALERMAVAESDLPGIWYDKLRQSVGEEYGDRLQ